MAPIIQYGDSLAEVINCRWSSHDQELATHLQNNRTGYHSRQRTKGDDYLARIIAATIGAGIGGAATALAVYAAFTGSSTKIPPILLATGSTIPMTLAYAAGLLLALQSPVATRMVTPFAAAFQMALTNYLMQSVLLSLLFYGYGMGLFGQVGSVKTGSQNTVLSLKACIIEPLSAKDTAKGQLR